MAYSCKRRIDTIAPAGGKIGIVGQIDDPHDPYLSVSVHKWRKDN